MNPDERTRRLQEIADGLTRRGLATPARIALDVIVPLGFLAGQAAQFARPLLPHGRWRGYASALEDEAGWQALQKLIGRR
jgi:hypothetical protein